jgi:alkylation response protein AidB-like acyl-CoA dehydrogenase
MTTIASPLHPSLDIEPLSIPELVADAVLAATAEAEVQRRLPPQMLACLKKVGTFRLQTPIELGGFECSLGDTVRVLEAFGRLDASAAWNVWNGNLGFVGAMLDSEGTTAVWGANPDPVIANSARVTGAARQVEGGYLLHGRWDLVSAIDSADWVGVFAIVTDGDSPRFAAPGVPDVRVFLSPTTNITILDTWHVNGMRGTGSNSVVANDVFVPGALAVSPMAPRNIDRPLFRIPPFTLASTGSAGVLCGLAQAAIDAVVDLAGAKPTDNGSALAHRTHAQAAIGDADAAVRATRAGLHAAIARIDEAAAANDPITPEMRAELRSTMSLVARTAREVVTSMYQLGSSSSIYAGNRIERAFRDTHVAAQHGLLNPTVSEISGRIKLGIDPGTPVF